jgi:2-polyprenyl-6-methoxyphenol hydroxylase-like FAD-dependent oxidoreductase
MAVKKNIASGTPLKIIINGAGLGGLGAAIALARKGHEVTVFESAKALSEVCAIIVSSTGHDKQRAC